MSPPNNSEPSVLDDWFGVIFCFYNGHYENTTGNVFRYNICLENQENVMLDVKMLEKWGNGRDADGIWGREIIATLLGLCYTVLA